MIQKKQMTDVIINNKDHILNGKKILKIIYVPKNKKLNIGKSKYLVIVDKKTKKTKHEELMLQKRSENLHRLMDLLPSQTDEVILGYYHYFSQNKFARKMIIEEITKRIKNYNKCYKRDIYLLYLQQKKKT